MYFIFQPQPPKEDNVSGPPGGSYPYGAPFSYNIPPGVESKESNVSVHVCKCFTDFFHYIITYFIFLG